jgi:hypothetical protein
MAYVVINNIAVGGDGRDIVLSGGHCGEGGGNCERLRSAAYKGRLMGEMVIKMYKSEYR